MAGGSVSAVLCVQERCLGGQWTRLGGLFTASENKGSRSAYVFTCTCSYV